tara:strand:+ start:152 stop:328 length:177 start_codon:yes stop_codon:yes gene_type:complete
MVTKKKRFAKYRIIYSDERMKGEIISAKNKRDAIKKSKVKGAPSTGFFKIKLLRRRKK